MKPKFNSKFQSILEDTKKILNELKGTSSIIDKNDNNDMVCLKSSHSKMSTIKSLFMQDFKNQLTFDHFSVSNINHTAHGNYPPYSSGVQPYIILDRKSPYQNFNTISYFQSELPKSTANLPYRDIPSYLIKESQTYSPSCKLNPLYCYPTYGSYMDSLIKIDKKPEITVIPTNSIQNMLNFHHRKTVNQYEIQGQSETKPINTTQKNDKDDFEQTFYDQRALKNLELKIKKISSKKLNRKKPKTFYSNNNAFNHKENENKSFYSPKTIAIDSNKINFSKTQNIIDKIFQNSNFEFAEAGCINSNCKDSISHKLDAKKDNNVKNSNNSISPTKLPTKDNHIDFQEKQNMSSTISNLDKLVENYSINYPVSSNREQLYENPSDFQKDLSKNYERKELIKKPNLNVEYFSKPDPYLLKHIPKDFIKNISDNLPIKKQPAQKSNSNLKTISFNLSEESMNDLLQSNPKTFVRDIDIGIHLKNLNKGTIKDKLANKETNSNGQPQKKNEIEKKPFLFFSPLNEKIDPKSIKYSKRIGNANDTPKQKENFLKKITYSKIQELNNSNTSSSKMIDKNDKKALQITKIQLLDKN